MEATVVKETVVNGRRYKEMSDGRIIVESVNQPKGSMFGTYATIKGVVTDEKLAKAKGLVIEEVCRIIREIANKCDDFFIIKNSPLAEEEYTTVGHKFFLPTVEGIDELDMVDADLTVE